MEPDRRVHKIWKMENEKVGNLTHSQLMEGLSSLLDKKLTSLASKEDLVVSSSEVKNLVEEDKVLKKKIGNNGTSPDNK